MPRGLPCRHGNPRRSVASLVPISGNVPWSVPLSGRDQAARARVLAPALGVVTRRDPSSVTVAVRCGRSSPAASLTSSRIVMPSAWQTAPRISDDASLRPRSTSEIYASETRAASATSRSVWPRSALLRRRISPRSSRSNGEEASVGAAGRNEVVTSSGYVRVAYATRGEVDISLSAERADFAPRITMSTW